MPVQCALPPTWALWWSMRRRPSSSRSTSFSSLTCGGRRVTFIFQFHFTSMQLYVGAAHTGQHCGCTAPALVLLFLKSPSRLLHVQSNTAPVLLLIFI